MNFRSTITIPNYVQPNFMHGTLHALVRNSYYRHRIIVLYSDPRVVEPETNPTADFEYPADVGDRRPDGPVQPYRTVEDFVADHRQWLSDNYVEMVDVTKQVLDNKFKYPRWNGGTDTAFKDNLGLGMTETEWTVPNWDCDFHPGWHWDKPIFDFIESEKPTRKFLIPMHVQPLGVGSVTEVAAWDAWRDSPAISCHRLAVPTTRTGNSTTYVSEPEFFAFCRRTARRGERIVEPCGVRQRLHWLPAVLRASELREAGRYSLMGSGYDIEIDDRLGRMGFQKVGFADAFILHKGFPPIESGQCPVRATGGAR